MFYFLINYSTYFVKISVDISITKPDNLKSVLFQFIGSYFIFFLCFCSIMTSTVQFDDKTCFRTIKIHDIVIDCFLSLKSHVMILQKTVP